MLTPKKEKKIKVNVMGELSDEKNEKHEPPINKYYSTVAYRYKFAKYLTIVLLIVFVLFSITVNRDSITYSNFVFLIKDMNTVFESDGILNVQKSISYNTDRNQSFSLYRRGLAVAGSSNIYVFNSAGKQTHSSQIHYSSPHFSTSEKYMLLYDLGGKGYSLYNSFAKIHSEELDYPITTAKISDSGVYAVVSGDREYTSSVSVYNKNFELIEKNRKDKYIIDIALDRDGEELLIASCESESGEYYTEISLSKIGSGQEHINLKKVGLFPIKAGYSDSGGFYVLCDKALLFFDGNGNETSSFDFGEFSVSRADDPGDRIVLLMSRNTADNDMRLWVFDSEGKKIYDEKVSGRINSVVSYGDHVYLLFDAEVKRVSHDDAKITSTPINVGVKKMLVINEATVLLCYASHTQYVELN